MVVHYHTISGGEEDMNVDVDMTIDELSVGVPLYEAFKCEPAPCPSSASAPRMQLALFLGNPLSISLAVQLSIVAGRTYIIN